MRSYHPATVALAIRRDQRWIDNVLSRHHVLGVESEGRGVARRLSLEAAVRLAIIGTLEAAFGAPIQRAVDVTNQLGPEDKQVHPAPGIVLTVDFDGLALSVERSLYEVMQHHVPPRRGRPPAKGAAAQL
jgi:hypothetical protein